MKIMLSALVALTLVGDLWAADADAAAVGREVHAKNQEAIVTIRLVVKSTMTLGGSARESESKIATVGTVIDPSGLTVVSLATMDPSVLAKIVLRSMRQGISADSEFKDVRIVLADNTELPATIVLRDRDLDVAFVRPVEKPARALAAIDLTKASEPRLLDEIISLNRLGTVANRAVTVSLHRIDALIERPRPFYLPSPGGYSGGGSPVFSMDGAPIGIILIRSAPPDGETGMGSMPWSLGSLPVVPVIIPAADLIEVAKQALEAGR